ncbi:precorrin-6A synthase (deacetylating) [Granulicella arctica]|uniref:precorrin-6A synthase (deacetylating) n=1 Tax=Granulicella arctica TaxID=940613 RepID=UPI0021DFBDD9|nr:precorrin-6A synthase (deacetylating) [Granulicella arctica]
MRKIYLIGIGAGNPEYITMQAVKVLNLIDVFFFTDKGEAKQDLVHLRKEVCQRYIQDKSYRIVEVNDPTRDPAITDYTARVEHWHQERVLIYEQIIARELEDDQSGAFLIWGDPSLYDSMIRIIDQVIARGLIAFEYEVIPGITSIQALAARHRVTLNGIGETVSITTGRKLLATMTSTTENLVVMLDGHCTFEKLLDQELEILWGAYLGMDDEILVRGKLGEASAVIEEKRTAARIRKGWIMDTYMLCKPRE